MVRNKPRTYSVGRKPQPRTKSKVPFLLIVLCLVVLAALFIWFAHHKNTEDAAARKAARTANNAHVKTEQNNGKSTSSSQQSSGSTQPPATQTNKDPGSPSSGENSGQAPESPDTYSTFVNTTPLALNDAAQTVCVTTPGATCSVEFVRDGVTKTLAAQTTDSTGTAYFNWTPKSAGLSPGDWSVILKATLHGSTKTAQDSQTLQITS